MSYYKDSDRLTVETPSISISKDLTDSTNLSIKYTYETFQKEPPSNAADAVTGATTVSGGTGGGFEQVRQEVVTGLSQRIGSTLLGVGYFYGDEKDYRSNAYSIAATQELFQKNLTLTALYGKTLDDVYKLDPPNVGFPKDKNTDTFTIAATQILTRRLLISGGYSYSRVDGFQSNPLRKVKAIQQFIQGIPIGPVFEENHPNLRVRQTFFLRFKQYFPSRTASDLNFSYYLDDWGVHAFTAEPRLEHYLSDSVILRLRYRFYSQSAADFYQPLYFASEVTNETIKTADVRLRKFDSHTLGVGLRLLGETLRDWSVLLTYDRYFQTNDGINADIYQLIISIPY
jgi:hypothetical protein